MSLLIKGMDMPNGCSACRCCVPEDVNSDSTSYYCALNNHLAWNTEHNIPDDIEAGCPLVEIPTPHGDLIDREEFIKRMMYKDDPLYSNAIVVDISSAPVIIEAEG